jgi:lipopolysaccharide export system protein LptC
MKQRPAWRRWWDALWSGVSLYLPLVIMACLALSTYWLYRNTPVPLTANGATAPKHEPNYTMKDFALRTFTAQGRLKSEVRGSVLHHYPDTDTLEISHVQLYSFDDRQQPTRATAQKALSNADGSEVQLFGNAHVLRNAWINAQGAQLPRMELQGEFLHMFVKTERVKSHLPVVLHRGNDRIDADRLDFSYLDRQASFNGRVKATFSGQSGR